jgi:hypothetical protein
MKKINLYEGYGSQAHSIFEVCGFHIKVFSIFHFSKSLAHEKYTKWGGTISSRWEGNFTGFSSSSSCCAVLSLLYQDCAILHPLADVGTGFTPC